MKQGQYTEQGMEELTLEEMDQVSGGSCYTAAFGAVAMTGSAILAPNPFSIVGAGLGWANAYEQCML
ncbi:hypothetical protein [Vibrio alginolyticus]|uniref:hypothetical protein n=1 Tax=Vibrio alginolyticus TaxID=663 RepID=UPI001303968C|nr:hypothetical protein [Vibrio alginolyticus]ELP9499398.1 hypothetical protein [Vibrio alginolyticus]